MKWRWALPLLAALLAGLFLFYSSRRPAVESTSVAVTDLISWSPEDANLFFFADLAAWRASPFFRQILSRLPAPAYDREYAEFVSSTGFDYSRDLDRLLIAVRRPSAPSTPKASRTNALTAIAEGRFDRERIHRVAIRSGRIERQDGREFYVVTAGNPPQSVAFAFLSDRRVALTEGTNLAPGLSVRRTAPDGKAFLAPPSALLPEDLRERVARVAGSAFFAVARMDGPPFSILPRGWSAGPMNKVLASVRWITIAAQPDADRVRLALVADCDSRVYAVQLVALLEGARLIGRRSLNDPGARRGMMPELAAALDVLLRDGEVSHDANRVTIRVEIPGSIFSSAPITPAQTR